MLQRLTGRMPARRPTFIHVVQIDPGLDVVAIGPAVALLCRLELGAAGIAPAALGKKGVPDLDLFLVRPPAPLEANDELKLELKLWVKLDAEKAPAPAAEPEYHEGGGIVMPSNALAHFFSTRKIIA